MTRRRFSERQVIATLIHQGTEIRCYRTKELITLETVNLMEREHLHEFALGGPDTPDNCRYSLKEAHARVTNGTKATTAGSSKNRLAKANEPGRIEKFKVDKLPIDAGMDKPIERCRSCGEYEDSCQCTRRLPPLSPLAGRKARERRRLG